MFRCGVSHCTGKIPQDLSGQLAMICEAVQILPPWQIRQSASTTYSALPGPPRLSWSSAILCTAFVCPTTLGLSAPLMSSQTHLCPQGEADQKEAALWHSGPSLPQIDNYRSGGCMTGCHVSHGLCGNTLT